METITQTSLIITLLVYTTPVSDWLIRLNSRINELDMCAIQKIRIKNQFKMNSDVPR